MCIIVYKPASVPLPDYDILFNCFDSNPDGCGLMYQDYNSNKVMIEKGFMSFDQLITAIENLSSNIDITANNIVLHFRYATQGSINAANCHPFPITDKVKNLKETTITVNTAMVHNGIISFCSSYSKNNRLSDTQIFVKDYLSKMNNSTLFNPAVLSLIEKSTSSKFIFMNAKQIELIGNFIEDQDIYYSNDTYKTSRSSRWHKPSKSKKQTNDWSITDYCVYCGKYTAINEYNGLCPKCEELIKERL